MMKSLYKNLLKFKMLCHPMKHINSWKLKDLYILESLQKCYTDENYLFKDDDTHVFIKTNNSVAIIKTLKCL